MNELQPGDRIDIAFVDTHDGSIRATVSRFLSDQQEGLSPEAENNTSCWMEITVDHQKEVAHTQTITFCTDWKYYLDGREVKIRKCAEPNCLG
jgi:hypothetical protein